MTAGDPVAPTPPERPDHRVAGLAVRPRPGPDVLAVIAAAADAAWPRPAPFPADERGPAAAAWRFSGRWWMKPVPLARERPRS